jgi:cell division protein FtsQ
VAGVAAGYFGWFRDSGLVAVRDVEIVGMRGPETAGASAALTDAAKEMTTLHMDEGQLAASVERFPTVASLSADPNFPHGLRITVTANPPVLLARAGGTSVLVGGDGTLLHGVEIPEDGGFPAIELGEMPPRRLAGEPLEQALVAGAAPDPLRPLIDGLDYTEEHGVEVTLEGGIPVRFGTSARAEQKWEAAAAVLADERLETLTYLDVRVPERPAVGGAAPQPAPEGEPTL